MVESEEELKSLLMRVNKESEKVGLKLNIQKTKIMASGPITSWEIDGEKWKWNRRGRGGHNFGKNDIPQEYNINQLESNGSKIADKSTSTRP